MKANRIKWDKSMAVRCLARFKDGYQYAAVLPAKVKHHKKASVKPAQQDVLSVDIPVGEWDGFAFAMNNAMARNHK